MVAANVTYIDFNSRNPRNPANSSAIVLRRAIVTYAIYAWEFAQSERFRIQREKEIAAQVMQRAIIRECEGEFPLPYPMPYHWNAEKVRHFAMGGSYSTPQFVGTVGTRIPATRKRVAGQTGLAA